MVPISNGGCKEGEGVAVVAHLVAVVVAASHVSVMMVMTVVHSGGNYLGLNSDGDRTLCCNGHRNND